VTAYAHHPQAWERDPVITPGTHGRADVASGTRGRWGRYNDPATLIYIDLPEGRSVGLTPNQAAVFDLIRTYANTGIRVGVRKLAAELHVAASTVYRACVRLAAWGLIAYQSNRGRNGGYMIRMREARDGLDWFRDEAKAKLRGWWKASEDRISRLRGNVASMFPGRESELYQYSYVTGRNIYGEWTAQDLQDAGL
jgi:predicted transcriptional regulator